MEDYKDNVNNTLADSVFEQYPWAGNHDDAISWLSRYMDDNRETVAKAFDERILRKVAKEHLDWETEFTFS